MTDTEKKMRTMVLAIKKADTEKSIAEKRSKLLREQLRVQMDAAGTKTLILADDKLQVFFRTGNEVVFDIPRILLEVTTDLLLSTKTLTKLSDTGFTKLVKLQPAIATARTSVAKGKADLVIDIYEAKVAA